VELNRASVCFALQQYRQADVNFSPAFESSLIDHSGWPG
jgi:hypothetical protein